MGQLGERASLKAGQVHVWFVCLDRTEAEHACFESYLWPEEQDQARRFLRPVDRIRYIVRRGMLRRLIGLYLGLDLQMVEFCRHCKGKPYLPARINPDDLQFSESDSDDMGAFGFARSAKIGIDIEKVREFADMPALVDRYFTDRERHEVLAGEKGLALHQFYRLWTRKEAVLKAQGEGLLKRLGRVDVSAGQGPGPWRTRCNDGGKAEEYHHMNIDAPAGFCSAIAVAGCLTDVAISWDLV